MDLAYPCHADATHCVDNWVLRGFRRVFSARRQDVLPSGCRRIVVVDDDDDAAALLTNVDQLWAEIEPTLRADHPEALFPMEQAVLLATTSVERRRPADASKGALILRDLAATLTD